MTILTRDVTVKAELNNGGVESVFCAKYSCGKSCGCILCLYRDHTASNKGPAIKRLIHKVHTAPVPAVACVYGFAVGIKPRVGR